MKLCLVTLIGSILFTLTIGATTGFVLAQEPTPVPAADDAQRKADAERVKKIEDQLAQALGALNQLTSQVASMVRAQQAQTPDRKGQRDAYMAALDAQFEECPSGTQFVAVGIAGTNQTVRFCVVSADVIKKARKRK